MREEHGVLMNKGTPEEELVVIGKYSYFKEDGEEHIVEYRADKNGYHPSIVEPPSIASLRRIAPNVALSLAGK